jgi:hypothetical protein
MEEFALIRTGWRCRGQKGGGAESISVVVAQQKGCRSIEPASLPLLFLSLSLSFSLERARPCCRRSEGFSAELLRFGVGGVVGVGDSPRVD